ncbi:MAG: porin family protein [Neomegalonema sp.]|nr:porin family protein [Neomegalonema sp.]
MTTTHKPLLLAAALCLLAGAVQAEDNWASKWHGPYAGGTIGLGAIGTAIERGAGTSDLDYATNAPTFGFVAGYTFTGIHENRDSGVLLGFELDAGALIGSKSDTDPVLGDTKLDASAIGSARLRLGYAWERTHLYATAGIALSDISVKGDRSNDGIKAGIALGLGGEYRLNDDWTGRAEFLAYGFANEKARYNGVERDTALGVSNLRIGITRKF